MSHVQRDFVEILELCFIWWMVTSLDPTVVSR